SFQSPDFAQIPSSENNNIVKSNYFTSSFEQVAAAPPLITNISSKRIYKVQLGSTTPVSLQSLPNSGFSTYITFMSATAQPATAKTVPNQMAQSGSTTVGGSGTQYRVPGSIQPLVIDIRSSLSQIRTFPNFKLVIASKHSQISPKAQLSA